ncbi:hypothetical protein HK105_203580 [Polyrhizophydium stewartii]|uniref:WDR11 second beta-propeller domain-containing protein n=1 Tax=Polyrhizophydium stewartii TaxID=2732419 RepID=A0ABR4NBI3_9FUNG
MDGDKATKEHRALKLKVETLERENMLLKKSLFELSSRYNSLAHKLQPFNLGEILDSALDAGINSLLENTDTDTNAERFANHDKPIGKVTRQFTLKHELKGHGGAVYAVQYSPCGRFISSGSFDKTVRIWDQKELHALRGHTLNVSDLSWSSDSAELLSGAYDQTCKTWDVESGKQIESYESEGFVLSVMFSPQDKNIFFSGTSRNILCVADRRDPSFAITMRNDSMVNTLYASRDGLHVVSGDSGGFIKTWDIRTGKCIVNESMKQPISHITCCPGMIGDEDPRYLAVNSYDNVIRVYDRGFNPPLSPYRLAHMLKGHKNKNWPIKSAFFKPRDNSSSLGGPSDDVFGKSDAPAESIDASNFEKEKSGGLDTLLATGSADPFVYVYSLGSADGSGELVQRLEGHTDRVYAVSFHPTEPILCSCSADFTLKLWSASKSKRK